VLMLGVTVAHVAAAAWRLAKIARTNSRADKRKYLE
jgi:hypothetical protein